MGCLNPNAGFGHWFGNIHLSGPCNRSCYFCIGQHMMALDPLNNLNEWPLKNIDRFVEDCLLHNINEINVTGSNTDPLLYKHTKELRKYLEERIPDLKLGLRTNGALALRHPEIMDLYDKASLSIHSFNPAIYKKMMGEGTPPELEKILSIFGSKPLKINMVLGPENTNPTHPFSSDLFSSLFYISKFSKKIKKVNLREPYGQPHIGDQLAQRLPRLKDVYGMPCYMLGGLEVTYWDVHYVEVESVNLYANGNISILYPVTKGCDKETGCVKGQEKWLKSGRQVEQWQGSKGPKPIDFTAGLEVLQSAPI